MSTVPAIALNNGVSRSRSSASGSSRSTPRRPRRRRSTALEVGYRHIDTAEMYGNEKEVGEAVARLRASTATRSSSRASSTTASTRTTTRSRRSTESLEALELDYLDLFLIHWPLPGIERLRRDLAGAWRRSTRPAGPRRSASPTSSRTTCAGCTRRPRSCPAVNQIEVHPYLTNDEVRAFDTEHGIATEAWSPIAQGKVLDDPIDRAASPRRTSKTPAQVDAALARAARRHRLPQVGDPQPGRGELRALRLRALRALTWASSPRSTGTSAPDPNPDEFNWIPRATRSTSAAKS